MDFKICDINNLSKVSFTLLCSFKKQKIFHLHKKIILKICEKIYLNKLGKISFALFCSVTKLQMVSRLSPLHNCLLVH